MMLVIRTQYHENYGAHDWDGAGNCPQYWKPKGGSEYKVTGVPLNIDYEEFVTFVRTGFEHSNEYSKEYMIDWSMEDDSYLSSFEQDQMKYDGSIQFAEPAMTYEHVLEKQKQLSN